MITLSIHDNNNTSDNSMYQDLQNTMKNYYM